MRAVLDAMGGDHAPAATVEGAVQAVADSGDLEVVLVGNEAVLEKELLGRKFPRGRITIAHAPEVIGMGEPAMQAIRKKRGSSIRKSFELVKAGQGDAVVSAGHSGAAMALALLMLGKAPGIDRPAIATLMPTRKTPFVLLDAGANVDSSAANLLQFAYMGGSYAKHALKLREPRVALLSIGEEDTKGNELTKETFKLLRESRLNFIGNIEGKDMFEGGADVVVCDGFVGNIVLKTSEGIAEVLIQMLREEIGRTTAGKLGFLLLKSAFRAFKKKTDYDEFGGAPLLGINGTCFISHGRSTPKAIKNALKAAAEFSRLKVNTLLMEEAGENGSLSGLKDGAVVAG